jgi:hypothetical protein
VDLWVHGPKLCRRACGVFTQVVVAFPISGRANGSRAKAASTVGAHVAKDALNTGTAERALERANHCFGRARRQSNVAMFATWSQFKHRKPLGTPNVEDSLPGREPRAPQPPRPIRPASSLWDNGVVAGAAIEHILAPVSDQHVVAGPAQKGVTAWRADQDVITVPTIGR